MKTTGVTGGVQVELGSFLGNLPELLAACVDDGRCLAGIAEFDDVRYVQFVISESRITIEVISNLYLSESNALSIEQESLLAGSNWSAPQVGGNPNWHQSFDAPTGIFEAAVALGDACTRILGKGGGLRPEVIELRTFVVHGARRVRDQAG